MQFIQEEAMHVNVLEMLCSDWWNNIMENQKVDSQYRSGAMFGASMAAVYTSTHAIKYSNCASYCKDCIYRAAGHPDKPWLPCKDMRDFDCCTYYKPVIRDQKDSCRDSDDEDDRR